MVKAAETDLSGVLEGRKQYQVPLYQRPYSWGHAQCAQLWTDIVDLTAARRTDPSLTHFIGSLVLTQSPDFELVGVAKLLVVDGQQRLTTLSLLLAALRDHLRATGDAARAEGVQAQYLANVYDRDTPPKLLPTLADRDAYLAVVRAAPDAGGSDKVGSAYNHFRAWIAAADDPDDPHDLEDIENAVVRGLSLVVVTAERGDNAHRIFESLNNTGLRLAQSDLLKNYLFMRLGERSEAVYADVWLPLEKKLGPENLELLFWLDLVQTDERAPQSETYVGQQKRLERFTRPDEIEAEVRRIAQLGDLLATILDPSREPDDEVRASLVRIAAWGSTTAYPLVMQILDRRRAGTATAVEAARALRYLESYFVRRVVVGRATAGLNRTLLQAVGAVAVGARPDVALRDFLSRGRKHFASDAQVREAVASVPFYWQGRGPQRKLILQWIEESYGHKEVVDPANLTIEHVLPQTMSQAVRADFAPSLPEGADVVAEHERIVHTLGNLTLTGYNPELSNRVFAQKRVLLATSGLRLNQAIAEHESWGLAEIRARGAALAEKIIELWPGPDESLVGTEDPTALHRQVAGIVAEIPAGRWTTPDEVALVAGVAPEVVASALGAGGVPGAWRVLASDGLLADVAGQEVRARLTSEGLDLDDEGRADPDAFLPAGDLAARAGLDVGSVSAGRRRRTRNEPLRAQRRAFQQKVIELGTATSTRIPRWPGPQSQYAVDISIGRPGVVVELALSSREPAVYVSFYILDDKDLYARLAARRAELERELGPDLFWKNDEKYKSSSVVVSRGGDWRDPAQSDELARWAVDTIDRFAEVFPRYM